MGKGIGRRQVLAGLPALAAAIANPALAHAGKDAMTETSLKLKPDGFFLSARNPNATSDQRDLETLAVQLFHSPEIQAAKERAKARWKMWINDSRPAEAWGRFDQMLGDEWAFQKIVKAVNSDPNHPKVMNNLWAAPHDWFGLKVPGGRAADNPDNSYGYVPINGEGRYELHGQRLSTEIDSPFQLVANSPMTTTLGLLDWEDVQFDDQGRFTVTLDPDPAGGRRNHIQTTPDAKYLLLRHSRADWRALPNAYRVKRLNPPTAAPLTAEQIRNRAAIMMIEDVPANYWWMHNLSARPDNTPSPAFTTAEIGGLSSQRLTQVKLRLEDDEAFVMTIRNGGASYRSLLFFDPLARTTDYWGCTSSLNNAQSVADNDETTTYVASIADPGVHNWIDTSGFHHGFLIHRWQGLPEATAADNDWAAGTIVKLKDLDRALPRTARRVTAAERQAQLAERLDQFKLRFLDT